MEALSKFSTPGIGFLLTVVFGFWLSRLGKPYNGILFNIHKLIALAAVVITAMQVYKMFKVSTPQQALVIFLIVVTVICIIALFASGAVMSIGDMNYEVTKTIHNIVPILGLITASAAMYLGSKGIP